MERGTMLQLKKFRIQGPRLSDVLSVISQFISTRAMAALRPLSHAIPVLFYNARRL